MIQDRCATQPLEESGIRHAKYVDNFLVLGHTPQEVSQEASRLEEALNAKGLLVHEVFGPSTSATFAGLEFDGSSRTARVSMKRIWKLRFALDFVLNCRCVSGSAVEAIVGHLTWAALARRETLCAFDHVYAFIREHYNTAACMSRASG